MSVQTTLNEVHNAVLETNRVASYECVYKNCSLFSPQRTNSLLTDTKISAILTLNIKIAEIEDINCL